MKEIWANVRGYEGIYFISNRGQLKRRNRIISTWLTHGYCHARLCKNGVIKQMKIHRLVAMAFIPNPDDKKCVNHKNLIKSDNVVTNLEWCSHSENTRHAQKNGRMNTPLGEQNGQSKLTNNDVIKIRLSWDKKESTQLTLAKNYRVGQSLISRIVNKKIWRTA